MAIQTIEKMEVSSNSFITREELILYRVLFQKNFCTILGTRYAEIPLQIYKTGSKLALSLLSLPYEKVCDVDLHWYNINRGQDQNESMKANIFTVSKGVFDEGEYCMTLIQQTEEVERHILCEKQHSWSNTINNTMSDTNIEYNDLVFTQHGWR